MNPEIKAAWVARLRAADRVSSYALKDRSEALSVLGQLAELAVQADVAYWGIPGWSQTPLIVGWLHSSRALPRRVLEWAGLPTKGYRCSNVQIPGLGLTAFDLGRMWSDVECRRIRPHEIADVIEAHL